MITVKPLDWEVDEPEWHVAKTVFNFGYEVRRTDRGGIRFRYGNRSFETFDGTFEEAKAHCQADYEARILSALTNTSGDDEAPVAKTGEMREIAERAVKLWRISGEIELIPHVDVLIGNIEAALSAVYALPQSAAVRDEAVRICDAVLEWMVKHDLLDVGNEYRAEDVLAVLNDFAPQPESMEIDRP